MNFITNFLITIGVFFAMEGVTWITHKFVMHGFLWYFHKDHHQPRYNAFFEKNDFFFVLFAIPSIILFALGRSAGYNHLFYIALGITLYGLAYFLVHDIFIHQRFKWIKHIDNFYFKGLRKAHKIHHKHLGKEDGECFGMLWVPVKYFKEFL